MDLVRELGALALATRMRRLSDRFLQGVGTAFRERGVDFEPRWVMLYYLLAHQGSVSITDAARALGISHPAVHATARELLRAGYVAEQTDPADRRRRLLTLTEAGQAVRATMEELWNDVRAAAEEVVRESGCDVLTALNRLEWELDRTPFQQRIRDQSRNQQLSSVEILDYDPVYQQPWKELNIAWVAAEYTVEQQDLDVLDDPVGTFIRPGGFVFLARLDGEIVGTAALKRLDADTLELCKMTVATHVRGRQVGQKLLTHTLQAAQASGVSKVTLETNKKAVAAIALYRKNGFQHQPFPADHPPSFDRADVYMEKLMR